jgi:hypothetical protein
MVKLDPEAMSAAEVFDICAEMAEMGFNQVIYTAVSPLHATVTAHALLASECLFRIGFVSFLLTAIFFLLTAWALYKLLKQVN